MGIGTYTFVGDFPLVVVVVVLLLLSTRLSLNWSSAIRNPVLSLQTNGKLVYSFPERAREKEREREGGREERGGERLKFGSRRDWNLDEPNLYTRRSH